MYLFQPYNAYNAVHAFAAVQLKTFIFTQEEADSQID